MKLTKRIIINIYSDGRHTIEEEAYDFSDLNGGEDKDEDIVRTTSTTTKSWENYNLIIYSKKSELFRELTGKKDGEIKIKFNGKQFHGKIDNAYARIYSLKKLMNYAKENNIRFREGDKVELIYVKSGDILCVNKID